MMKLYIWMIALILLMAGCSGAEEENTSSETQESKNATAVEEQEEEDVAEEEEDIETAPFQIDLDDVIGWMKAGPGKYAGEDYNGDAVEEEIASWSDGLEPEEYFYRLQALTAEDFREYQEYLEKIEVEFESITETPTGEVIIGEGAEDQALLNVQILLDTSGSMAGEVDGGVKLDLAKEAISNFAAALPEGAHVSMRVLGQDGETTPKDKAESCAMTAEVYELGKYEEDAFADAMNQFILSGHTPLALAIEEAGKDLADAGAENTKNIIYVVSDGNENCGGDPVSVAEQLVEDHVETVINIIGFDIEEGEREALEAIADAGKGEYFRADTAEDLKNTFEREKTELINAWYSWESDNLNTFYSQESNYLNESYDLESDALNLSYDEETRQKNLTFYMDKIMEEADTREVRRLISERADEMRDYLRSEHDEIREQAREMGDVLRNQVRDQGDKERDELRGDG